VADLDGDGYPDIAVANQSPGAVYFNDGTGHKYQRVTFGDNKGAIYGLAAADLDGDGYPDIVAARSERRACCCSSDRSANHSANRANEVAGHTLFPYWLSSEPRRVSKRSHDSTESGVTVLNLRPSDFVLVLERRRKGSISP
jgi:hypothetical protein